MDWRPVQGVPCLSPNDSWDSPRMCWAVNMLHYSYQKKDRCLCHWWGSCTRTSHTRKSCSNQQLRAATGGRNRGRDLLGICSQKCTGSVCRRYWSFSLKLSVSQLIVVVPISVSGGRHHLPAWSPDHRGHPMCKQLYSISFSFDGNTLHLMRPCDLLLQLRLQSNYSIPIGLIITNKKYCRLQQEHKYQQQRVK